MTVTVEVKNISTKTSEDEIKSFFSFCGKIQSVSVKPAENDTQSATVTFEKPAAAKTALLLDNTQLGPNSVHVTSPQSIEEHGDKDASSSGEHKGDHIEQEEKPRARIVAEYLAQGYTISDGVIEKALALDKQHGVSQRFTQALQNFDSRFHASEKAQAMDQKLGVTDKLVAGWRGLTSYFDKASTTPTGQKLRQFYDSGNKTVLDVHNEARHLADLKKKEQGPQKEGADKSTCSCGGDGGVCTCPSGKCACAGCEKKATSTSASNA